ncbi:MAG: SAM-dependent methyltransferase [Bacteroidetes bacterium]|nr:MAG: SAM-dependent methyltransferase [Bacteroidota bacterium]
MNRKQHWETVYETKADQEVGWFQENPEISLKLVEKYAPVKDASFIDIGGGNSFLSKHLFNQGFSNLTILDISAKALERSKSRFVINTEGLNWIESNVLDFSTESPYKTWHDRAVFHFLTSEYEIDKYADVAAKNIVSGGFLILATFSLSGPENCSGLPISQYSEKKFCCVFNDKFDLIECFEDVHTTPSGNPQNFIWAVFKRK